MTRLALSPSGLSLLQLCGEAFRRRYIEGERVQTASVQTVVGKATHKVAEVDMGWKVKEGELFPTEDIKDLAADAFEAAWDEEPPEEKAKRGKAKDQTLSLSSLYHEDLAPTLSPWLVEHYLRVDLEGYPFDLHGRMDLVTTDGGVRDLKTRSARPTSPAASIQGELYSFLRSSAQGKAPPSFSVDTIVKKKKPEIVTHTVTPSGEFTALKLRLERAAQVIESGAFMPADPEHWKCSARYCEFFDTCAFGRARRVAIGVTDAD